LAISSNFLNKNRGTMANTFKLFADKMGGRSAAAYIGTKGEIFYDTDGATPIRLSDGVTPGGIPFGIVSINETFDPQFKTVSGNTLAGTVATGSYVLQGLICHFRINVNFANTTDFGSASQYQVTLPFPSVSTMTQRGGTLHNEGLDARYHIAGITDIDDASPDANNTMRLYYSGSTTDLAWKSSTPVGATTTTAHFDISGAYQIAT
jgi:hypothetical protein